MVRGSVVLILSVLIVPGASRGAAAPAEAPRPVLVADRESELAPHGEGNVYAPHVLVDGDVHRMWYGGQGKDGHDRIQYAESADGGRTWAKRGVVLEDRKANHVNDPSVVKVGDAYYMYYTRTERDVVDRIDVAISTDRVKWEPKGPALVPGPAGAWDALSVGRPSVIREGGVFKMWYDGRKDFPPGAPVSKDVPKSPTSHRSVGYATSTDGFRWTRHDGGPVFGNDAGGVDVKRIGGDGGRLAMAYESRDGTRLAVSEDGVAWADKGLLVASSGTDVDAFGHVTPCLLGGADGAAGRLFVGAARAATWDRNCVAEVDIGTALASVAGAVPWTNPIVKRGYLDSPLVETTPFVFNDKLYRLESWQKYWELPNTPPPNTRSEEDAVRVFDVAAGKVIAVPLVNHGFATALVWEGRIYVFAAKWDRPRRKAGTITMTSSADLKTWTEPVTVLKADGEENLYNVAVCRGRDGFVLLYETDDTKYVPFTFKYCASSDMKTWTPIPGAFYGREKYVGGPGLYFEGDTYYTLYLQDLGGKWETRVARSKDLLQWEDAPPGRPVVTFDETKTRVPLRPPEVKEVNASDVELCEWPRGKTFLYFTGSDQQYAGDLQCAEFDGPPRALLEQFFK